MIGDIFYNLFITPLELIFEAVFWLLQSWPVPAIAAICIVINILALPLYKYADAVNAAERRKAALLADRASQIRKTFKGSERCMVLMTYYRESHYNMINILRSTFPLLLQIPVFIAAYGFFTKAGLLEETSFLFISDLSEPDQIINFGEFTVNLLPIIMAVITVLASLIYLEGSTLREKIITFVFAAAFLAVLYDSPSSLVLYWTFNQLFFLLKNIFVKLVKSRKTKDICASAVGIVLFIAMLCAGMMDSWKKLLLGVIILIVCQLPAIISLYKKKNPEKIKNISPIRTCYFIMGGIFLSVLMGLVIPLSAISLSPAEFAADNTDFAALLINNFCICAGFFIIWAGLYFYVSKSAVRNIFTYAALLLSGLSIFDYLVFPGSTGIMTTYLVYDSRPEFDRSEVLINLACAAALAAALILVMKLAKKAVPYIYGLMFAGCIALLVINAAATVQGLAADNNTSSELSSDTDDGDESTAAIRSAKDDDPEFDPIIPLSRTGKNVVVLMLDRAISGYIPYIFNEKPELAEKFEGFTYYPNTVSFGGHTNFSTPSLFGGYEYTPYNMNLRSDETLGEKHDEAIKVLPTLFGENGYEVTVCDIPYAGYSGYWPDLSVYDGMENVTAHYTYGQYTEPLIARFGSSIAKKQNHNFFFYSLFRAVPELFRNTVYNNGNYYAVEADDSFVCSDAFLDTYSVLYYLPQLTEIRDDDQGTLLLLDNETTHSPSILKTPEYEPSENVSGDIYGDKSRFTLNGVTVKMETETQIGHYDADMAAYIQVAKWLDYLREMGVYDNTRIIIVSDHGSGLGQFDELITDSGWDIEWVNSLMMVKDFNSDGELQTSDEFMTAADVPYLALNGVIDDMTNPFTGNEITDDVDKEEQLVTSSHYWDIRIYNGNTFETEDCDWWKVHGNVWDTDCWEKVEAE